MFINLLKTNPQGKINMREINEQERRWSRKYVHILSRRMNSWCSQSVQSDGAVYLLLIKDESIEIYIYINNEKKEANSKLVIVFCFP